MLNLLLILTLGLNPLKTDSISPCWTVCKIKDVSKYRCPCDYFSIDLVLFNVKNNWAVRADLYYIANDTTHQMPPIGQSVIFDICDSILSYKSIRYKVKIWKRGY